MAGMNFLSDFSLKKAFIIGLFSTLFLPIAANFSAPYFTSYYHKIFPNNTTNEEKVMNLGEAYHSYEVFLKNYVEMEKKFKIFVYPDGDDNTYYHTPRSISGKYASEGYFFKNIRESSFITRDPDQAHLFFIPISCHKMHGEVSSYDQMAKIVEEYISGLIHKYPYWNRTLGADHFFLTCHEIDVGATELIPHLVKNSIRVVCSSTYTSGFIPHKDISLPQVMQPFTNPIQKEPENRTELGYWAGNINTDLRRTLMNLWEHDEELDINRRTVEKDIEIRRVNKFYKTKFCICPRGPRATTSRITMAIHYGCIPVILSNNFDLPFNDILDWRKFSVIVNERDVYLLKDMLKAISAAEFLYLLHKNLVEVRKSFQWNSPPEKYDAFHMILYDLWLRRNVARY